MCKLLRITQKLNIKLSGFTLFVWVIRRSLHIDKIHKNKINSYNKLITNICNIREHNMSLI